MGIIKDAQNMLARASEALKIGWSLPPNRTTDLWLEYAHTSPMLDPVHMIASDVAGVPFKLFTKQALRRDPQNAEPILDHLVYDIMEHPMPDHPEIDYFAFMYLIDVYYELIGDAFILIDRDQRGKPAGFYIIPPNWVLLTPTMNIPYFRIQPMGNTSHRYFNADPQDVVWLKAPNVANPYGRGIGRSEAVGDEIETHEYSSKYAKNFYYNDATPPIIMEMPGISKPDADAFKESWMQRFGGFINARKPAIVGQKDFKVHQLATTPKEMDFTESRKYLVQMANEHFCVPPEMRGNLQNSNRSTIDSAYYLWTKNVVAKRLRAITSAFNNQLLPLFDKNLVWKFDEIVPEDNEAKMRIANDGLSRGTVTRNEWRKIASSCGVALPEDTGRGDVYLIGLTTTEVKAFDKPAPAPEPEETPEETAPDSQATQGEPIEDDAGEKIDLDIAIKELEKISFKSMLSGEDRATRLWKAFDARATSVEEPFYKATAKIAKDQSAKFRSIVGSELNKSQDDAAIDRACAKMFTPSLDADTSKTLTPAWMVAMDAGREHGDSNIGKSFKKADDSVYNAWFSKWVKQHGLKKAKIINDTTNERLQADLKAVIAASIDEGVGLREMKQRVYDATDGVYDDMDHGARATLIARTETASSVNAGTFASYSVAGVQKKEWLNVLDNRTRDAHADIAVRVVGMDEKFMVGGEEMDYPGDPSASAANLCNCRCALAAVMSDEED